MENNAEKLVDNYFDFVFTKDGSVGLYNHDVGDIYHSTFGAMKESEEKFIKPLVFEKNYFTKKHIKVLDICYGIGYNTKALIKKALQVGYKGLIEIDALEYDKKLVLISPFIIDCCNKLYPEISYILLSHLYEYIIKSPDLVTPLLLNKKNKKYIPPFYRRFIRFLLKRGYTTNLNGNLKQFLHNIYYHCISPRIKKAFKTNKSVKIKIVPHFNDARKTIMSLLEEYDIIFLDAFTPTKLPTLWSLDFFKELYRLCSQDCILVTYSNSASIRHAMLDAGFHLGKIFDNKNRASGTIASKNKDLIINELDEYDLGLLDTNAGVYFRDEKLMLTAEEILQEWTQRKAELKLQSTSQYIKEFKRSKHGEI